MVIKSENYTWSSAAGHCRMTVDSLLSNTSTWKKLTDYVDDWSAWLAEGDAPNELAVLRPPVERATQNGHLIRDNWLLFITTYRVRLLFRNICFHHQAEQLDYQGIYAHGVVDD